MPVIAQAAESAENPNLGGPLLFLAVVLGLFAYVMQKRREKLAEEVGFDLKEKKVRKGPRNLPLPPPPPPIEVRPRLIDVVIDETEARVAFAAAPPPEPDEIFTEMLVNEGMEALRDRQNSSLFAGVTSVVVLAEHGGSRTQVARVSLETPGLLPPRSVFPSILDLTHIALDPIDIVFERGLDSSEDLGTNGVAADLRLPRAVETVLRAQGIDPLCEDVGDLIIGILPSIGYKIEDGPVPGVYIAQKHGSRTHLQLVPSDADGDSVLDADTMSRFAFEFQMSQCERGLLITGRRSSPETADRERREPRIRFLTVERIQGFLDGMGLS